MTREDAENAVDFIKKNIPFDTIGDVADIASNFGSKEFQDVCGKISEMAGLENQSAIVMNMISNIIKAEQNPQNSYIY